MLKESCEGNWMSYAECSQDALQFKGVFVRYLVSPLRNLRCFLCVCYMGPV